jgi:predicted PurR-regulated permease PerM
MKKSKKKTPKKRVSEDELKKYLLWFAIAALAIVSFIIIRPFIVPLVSAFVLAYLALPLFRFLNKKINRKLSALICIAIIILIILLPLGGIITGIANQAQDLLNPENTLKLKEFLSQIPFIQEQDINLTQILKTSVNYFVDNLSQTATAISSAILAIFIILVGIYYILIDWETLSKHIKKLIPFKDKEGISKEISKATRQIIYGTALVALIGFITSLVGFLILGIDNYLFYSALMAILLFVPIVGPVLLWVPLAIYYFASNQTFQAIGVIILGLILSNVVDNLIRMQIVGDKAKINPMIMLIGIVGGIATFGLFGFIIGPLILVYTIKLIEELVS